MTVNQDEVKHEFTGVFTGVAAFTMMNVAAILSGADGIRVCRVVFSYGGLAVLFYSDGSESALPRNRGLYLCGKEAFGPKTGLLTVAMQWFNSLPYGNSRRRRLSIL